ncbi:MAG: phosphonoacetaldehyde reductase [Synergistaceae bacterium]|jgi:alcohol dehydrogenase class IV|nr:phosphonoacetaldehyde reductase [Synergistaceae bacterium]
MTERLIFGNGSIEALSEYLILKKPRSILLLHGKQSYAASGLKARLKPLLRAYNVTEWDNFSSNPSYTSLISGLDMASKCNPDLIIASGGGSVIDMGKLVGVFHANRHLLTDRYSGSVIFERDSVPIAAIPTTTGTGSEATHFAVLWQDKEKFSVVHGSMLPELAIVDPSLAESQPPYLRSVSALDALAQGIESYWCVNSTDESKRYAKEAIEKVHKNLSSVSFSYEEAAIGAYAAGKAINITQTTAPHAVSYALTGYYGIPHGNAVFLTLPSFFEYNHNVTDDDCLDARGAVYVRETMRELVYMLGANDIGEAVYNLRDILHRQNISGGLSDYGITAEAIDHIVKNGFNPQRVNNNPRLLTENTLRSILTSIIHE